MFPFKRNKKPNKTPKTFNLFRTQYMFIYESTCENLAIEKDMLSKYCPINNSLCNSNCVHFSKGTTHTTIIDDFSTVFKSTKRPSCKLW